MKRDPERFESQKFDLLIIGGGITGATLAWDASMRGLKVAVVDKGDFGCATSSATSKLIHGGLRYLKNGELLLVRESLQERRILQSIAGHLVRPMPFLLPTYRTGGNRRWMIRAGMLLYDMLSYHRGRLEDPEQRIGAHRMLSAAKVERIEPLAAGAGLTGGAWYYDCLCNPDRLTLEFMLGAFRQGATLANYMKVNDVVCSLGRVESVAVEDLLSGRQFNIQARMVANTAGPWADRIDLRCGVDDQVSLHRSKGIHIITRSLGKEHTLVMSTSTGGHFFIIPWRGHSLIGTTDTEFRGDPDSLSVQDQDVSNFLAEINQALPKARLTEADILYRYAGMRPLVDQESKVYQASRKYEIIDHHRQGIKGYISAVGGKYTTSRNLARKLTDRIMARLDSPKVACLTAGKRLPGAVSGSFRGYVEQACQEEAKLLDRDILKNLVWTYGSRHIELIDLVKRDPNLGHRLQSGRPEIMAQIVFAIESEMACTLCDILVRRTGFATLGSPQPAALDRIVRLAGRLLGWGAERRQSEKETLRQKILGQAELPPSRQKPTGAPPLPTSP